MPTRGPIVIAALAGLLAAGLAVHPAAAQTADPAPPVNTRIAGESQAPPTTPNFDRIREALDKPPALVLNDGQLRIYVEVIAKWPRFDEVVKGYDLRHGPTPRGAVMTHQEFLQMVTPRELYGSAGIRPGEVLQMTLIGWLGKALVLKALDEIREARSEREIQEIRARIDRELAALRGGR